MEEPDVVVSLCEYLNEQGYRSFVDASYDSDQIHRLPERFENCGFNSTIRIESRIPDIIGFTPQKDIFAIEVKGDDGVRKGIGQAAHYRQGVHRSYLAAEAESIQEFRETALACGVGVYQVTPSTVHPPEEPNKNIAATKLNKTRRELAVKTSGFTSAGKAFASTTRPVNAFLPVIYLVNSSKNSETRGSETEYINWVAQHPNGVGRGTSRHVLSLAKTLQLVRSAGNSDLQLTEIGRCGYSLLRGRIELLPQGALGLDSSQLPADSDDLLMIYLSNLKSRGKKKLYQSDSEIAVFFRDRYVSIPDVRFFIHILATHQGSRAELSLILAKVAIESPDVFLNLFVDSSSKDEFKQLMEDAGSAPEDQEFRTALLALASRDYLYNFIYQIWHIGILQDGTQPVHQNDELEMGKFYWEWDERLVGELSLDEI